MTPYQMHVQKCKNCTACDLYRKRSHVVVARGKIPADILFIGEAPGQSEDVIGKPFVGPAGKLLGYIIDESIGDRFSCCIANLVRCIPLGEDGDKVSEPPKESIKACRPYLIELMELCRPRLIVCVGKLALKWLPSTDAAIVEIIHPAAILRADISQKGLAIQRSIITLLDAAALL